MTSNNSASGSLFNHFGSTCCGNLIRSNYHTNRISLKNLQQECTEKLESLEEKVSQLVVASLANNSDDLLIKQKKQIGNEVYLLLGKINQVAQSGENSAQFYLNYIRAVRLCVKCSLKGFINLETTDDFLAFLIRERERLTEIKDPSPAVPHFVVEFIKREITEQDVIVENEDWLFDYTFNAFKTNPVLIAYASNINLCQFLQQYLSEYVSLNMNMIGNTELEYEDQVIVEKEFFESVFYWAYYVANVNSFVVEENSLNHMKKICEQYDAWKGINKDVTITDLETGLELKLDSCMEVVRGSIYVCEGNLREAEKSLNRAIEIDPNNVHASGLLLRECTLNLYPEKLESLQEINNTITRFNRVLDTMRNKEIGGELPTSEIPLFSADTNVKASILLHAASLVNKESKSYGELIKKSKEFYDLSDKFIKLPYNILNLFNRARLYYSLEDYTNAVATVEQLLSIKFKLTEDQIRDSVIIMNLSLINSSQAKEAITKIEPYVRGMAYDLELRYSWLFAHEALIEQSKDQTVALHKCIEEYQKLLTPLQKSHKENGNKNLIPHISHLEKKIEQIQAKYSK
ncbi:predicted protein [Naegleria gruberi]|uniref:Predicted protein n=1 Tax=Naegleria gruberi TaxID=5762 RepID=D2VY58_NAEGR|nr:uncharacterized protein NAEGRDRAFT_53180 [Naegleria gruberi]EFC38268.1 predicted protein [Naegleria gruberi]|eukprot:XP_002671012.1 predicted protein [Naegleria gruberi strain NEG-M]